MRTQRRSHRRGTRVVIAGAAAALALPTAAIAQGPAAGGQYGVDAQATKASDVGEGVPHPGFSWSETLEGYGNSGTELVFDTEGHVLYQGMNEAPDDDEETLVAIDRASGEIDWTRAGVNYRCGVAASDDGLIYGVSVDGHTVLAIDATDGSLADSIATQEHSEPMRVCPESLRLADNGTLVVQAGHGFDMHMQAFDTAGGLSHRWTKHYHVEGPEFGADAESTSELDRPVISADGDAIYHCREKLEAQRPDSEGDQLLVEKVDLATGNTLAEVAIHENAPCQTLGVVAIDGGVVVAAQGHGEARYRMTRIADNGNNLSIEWQVTWSRDENDDESGLVEYPADALSLSGDTIIARIAGEGSYVGVDIDTGDVMWQYDAGLMNTYEHMPVDRHGNVYVSNHDAILESFTDEGHPRFAVSREELLGEDSGFGVKMVAVGPDGGIFLRGFTNGDDATIVRVDTAPANRVAGLTRYDTAAQIALNNFRTGVDTVFLAVGTNFPDALTGGPLAAHLNAPVLLADTASLPAETSSALDTLRPNTVVALGGTGAISDEVLAAAGDAADGAATDRIFGASRYGTAAAIAERLPASDTVYLAVGTNYPDTLAGGPATDGAPILLTETNHLPQETIAVLQDRRPSRVVGLGGSVAISDEVLAQAGQAAGGADVDRVKGQTRYGTGVEIAQTVVDDAGFQGTVFVAVGTNYPDAVSAASAAEAAGAPIVLTAPDHLPDEVATWLAGLDGLRHIVILGGTGAISDEVAADLAALVS